MAEEDSTGIPCFKYHHYPVKPESRVSRIPKIWAPFLGGFGFEVLRGPRISHFFIFLYMVFARVPFLIGHVSDCAINGKLLSEVYEGSKFMMDTG